MGCYYMNCSSVGPFRGGIVLQEQTAPAWVPHCIRSPARKPALAWAPFSMGYRSYQEPAPTWDFHGVTASFKHSHLFWREVLHGLQVEISTVDHHGLQGTACLTMVFTTGCGGMPAPVPGACPPPLFTLTLVSAESFLTYSHSCLLAAVAQQFFLLLIYVIMAVVPPSLMDSPLSRSGCVLEQVGIGSAGDGGSLCYLPTEGTPVAPCYQNLATQTQYKSVLKSKYEVEGKLTSRERNIQRPFYSYGIQERGKKIQRYQCVTDF